ncbi:MAG: hypothetical protein QNJ77_05925 [Acidimicrobiia bacterium]|nr:hypothetical protein [Acidimicrobiia bacterium]
MHAVTRSYIGTGASELFNLIEQRRSEVEALLRGVTGFVSYAAFRTPDGGVTVTVCEDKAGTDESIGIARDWVAQNASDLATEPPLVAEGHVIVHLT